MEPSEKPVGHPGEEMDCSAGGVPLSWLLAPLGKQPRLPQQERTLGMAGWPGAAGVPSFNGRGW